MKNNKTKTKKIKKQKKPGHEKEPGLAGIISSGGLPFNLMVLLLFTVLAGIIYSNSFQSPFQFDDTLQILAKDRVQDLNQFKDLSEWMKVSRRPLSFLSFAINYHIGQYDVFGYHLVNLIIHIFSGFVVFILIRQLFRSPVLRHTETSKHEKYIALFAALIFLVHPIQTQGVTYIVQRMASMSALFYMLSVYFYGEARLAFISGKKNRIVTAMFGLAVLTALASLLTKQVAASIPFAWLLYEICFVRDPNGKLYKKFVAVYSIILGLGIAFVAASGLLPAETKDISRSDYLFTQFRVIAKYLQLLILPINQNLDYDFSLSRTFFSLPVILSFLLLVAILFIGVKAFRKHRIITFGIFWFLIALSVESSIIPIRDVIFEHRLYLPLPGFTMILAYVGYRFLTFLEFRHRTLALTACVLIFSLATYARNEKWRTQYTIWKDVSEKSPGKSRSWYNLGKVSLDEYKYPESARYLQKCLAIDPDHTNAIYNLGLAYEKMQDLEKAEYYYTLALEKDSAHLRSLNNLGNLYIEQKEYGKAIVPLRKAFEINSEHLPVLQNLGIAYFYAEKYEEAIQINKIQLDLYPNDPVIQTSIAKSLMHLKQYNKAIHWLEKAVELNPGLANAYVDLGTCYFSLSRYDLAVNFYQKSLQMDPGNTVAEQYLSLAKKRAERS